MQSTRRGEVTPEFVLPDQWEKRSIAIEKHEKIDVRCGLYLYDTMEASGGGEKPPRKNLGVRKR